MRYRFIALSALSVSLGLLSACNESDSLLTTDAEPFDLTILHINDHHSHLEEDSLNIAIGTDDVEFASGGFPRVVSAFKSLEANADNVLKLHAGDAITGTLYYTLFQGEADAAMMNQVCFDAFALGNHEFDSSDEGLKTFLDYLNPAQDAVCPKTPVLAANIQPALGTPLYADADHPYLQPYAIKNYGSQKVGMVGIDIKSKTQNSSSPLDTTEFLDEVTSAQNAINELKSAGVNKIILLTHYQYANDQQLATQLDGVDVIVGGDSHTLLGDFSSYGLNSSGAYPTKTTDIAGNPVCIVQAWQYAQVVGELNVSFDGDGVVTSCEGTPHLLIEPSQVNATDATEEQKNEIKAVMANMPNLTYTEADSSAQEVLQVYQDQKTELGQQKIGEASEDLCLERIPGQGRSTLCTADETKPHGGDIQTLVAHAFRKMALRSDISIQNAGGVRIDVPQGDISIETAYTLLPFANTLVELTMTGSQIKQVLEEAVDFALDADGSTGAYPYAAGLRWDMDLSQSFGNRLSNLQFKARDGDSWTSFDLQQQYVVVTNNYTAGGKDGYLTFADIQGDDYVDTYLDYAQSFVDYVKAETEAGNTIDKLPYSEYSTQNFTDTDGQFYPTLAP
ncbi:MULTISPECIES: NAD nucleotidase [Thiomicrorhabdus]|uniref:NAD nucleotidase n=1 Tax=Thiomicrorhabdus heinhorstiae TaxID=2748010 RepID=A0ABS0BVB2_9GAMM|nr:MULTISPECIES: NAD nucleotidase [Thiomicrorhabdus]MBF6056766.1 NAD nucleotidase [Thiomicrorhabdus heinhorstiae]